MNENIPNTFYRIGAKALVLDKDGKFLLIKEKNDFWELPGGGIEWGESAQETIKREVMEEMNINVLSAADNPSYFLTTTIIQGPFVGQKIANIIYKTELENLDFSPSDECVEIGFFSSEDVISMDVFSNVADFARQYQG